MLWVPHQGTLWRHGGTGLATPLYITDAWQSCPTWCNIYRV